MNKQSTSKSFAILGTTSIIVKMLGLIYIPFTTAILGDYGNNIVSKGYIVFTFLYSLSNAGLPNAISKLVSEQTTKGNFRAAQKILKCSYLVMMLLGIIIALSMIFGAKFIANMVGNPKDTYLMIITLSPTLIFTSISCAFRGYFQGRQNMVPVAISQVIEQILNTVFTVVFAAILIKYGVKYGAAGTTIGTIVGAIGAAAFLCYIYFNLTRKQRKKEIEHTDPNILDIPTSEVYKQIAKYSLPAIINTIAVSAAGLIDVTIGTQRLVASHHYTEKTAGILFGIYGTQFTRLFTLAIAFSTALVTSMIPAISEALALKDHRLVRQRVNESYKAIYLVTVPSIAGISFLAIPLFILISPTDPLSSVLTGNSLIIFGTWTAILMTIQYVQSAVLIGSGKPAAPSINLIIGMAVKTVLNYVLIAIPSINIKGAIIGSAVGWGIAIVLNQISIKKSYSFKTYLVRLMIKPAFASVIMGAASLLFYKGADKLVGLIIHHEVISNDIAVFIAAGFGAAIYFGVMIIIRGVTKKDIVRLPMGTKIYRLAEKVPFLRVRLNV